MYGNGYILNRSGYDLSPACNAVSWKSNIRSYINNVQFIFSYD